MPRLAHLPSPSWALLLIVSSFALAACAATGPLPGRCESNADCAEGERCVATYCEDVYFPRSTIKNY